MKQFLLPIGLMTFTVVCLSIVHIDNVNKLEAQSNELRKKYENEFTVSKALDKPLVIPQNQ